MYRRAQPAQELVLGGRRLLIYACVPLTRDYECRDQAVTWLLREQCRVAQSSFSVGKKASERKSGGPEGPSAAVKVGGKVKR